MQQIDIQCAVTQTFPLTLLHFRDINECDQSDIDRLAAMDPPTIVQMVCDDATVSLPGVEVAMCENMPGSYRYANSVSDLAYHYW